MDETWLVTGAGRGIGLAVASAHLARGGRVLASVRNGGSQPIRDLQARYGARLDRLDFDLRDGDAISRAAASVRGPVDVLFNNAGIFGPREASFRELDAPGAIEAFDVNALGAIRVISAFLPLLEGAPRPRIVAVSSLMGAMSKPGTGALAYRLSKAALNRAVQIVGEELAPRGIAVACLRPGYVRTGMTDPSAPMTPEASAGRLLAVTDSLEPRGSAVFLDISGELLDW